jgi:hypothetical protein
MKTCKDCKCEIVENIRCVECQKVFKHNIYLRNKDNQIKRQKKKRENNLETYKDYSKNYYNNNKEKCNEACKSYKKKRRKEDPIYKFRENIRGVIGRGFRNRGFDKNSRTYEILGCDFETFKKHIESLWQPWMNWDNYGVDKRSKIEPNQTWDIDHIIPVSNGKTEKEIIELNHYINLQPLCSHYNRFVKGTNLE